MALFAKYSILKANSITKSLPTGREDKRSSSCWSFTASLTESHSELLQTVCSFYTTLQTWTLSPLFELWLEFQIKSDSLSCRHAASPPDCLFLGELGGLKDRPVPQDFLQVHSEIYSINFGRQPSRDLLHPLEIMSGACWVRPSGEFCTSLLLIEMLAYLGS